MSCTQLRFSILAASTLGWALHGNIPLDYSRYEALYEDGSYWIVEQMHGGNTGVENGTLEIDDAKGCTVWFKHKLSGSAFIELDRQ